MESSKQFNLDGWYEFVTRPEYIDWAVSTNKQHYDDIQWMRERTNRLPLSMVKNAKALAVEHGWKTPQEMYDRMLKEVS